MEQSGWCSLHHVQLVHIEEFLVRATNSLSQSAQNRFYCRHNEIENYNSVAELR